MKNLEHSLDLQLISPIYLLYGEETLLMEQMLERICHIVSPDDQAWNKETYQAADLSPEDIIMNVSQGGFMGMRRLVIVRDIDWFRRSKTAAASVDLEGMIAYAADPNPDAVLVLLVNGNVPSNSRLLKAVNKGGRAAQFPAIKGAEKERWLLDYLHQAGKVPDAGVVSYVALMSGDGLLPAKSEADKLILYTHGQTNISMEDAESIVSRGAMAGVFDLSDRMAEKNGATATDILRRLYLQGEAPQKLLAMIGSQYHNTLAVKDLMNHGFSSREAAARLGINPYVATKCAAQARRYTNRELSRALEILLNADIAQKRGEGDMKELLEVAILRICAM